jgi:hypothetical protein
MESSWCSVKKIGITSTIMDNGRLLERTVTAEAKLTRHSVRLYQYSLHNDIEQHVSQGFLDRNWVKFSSVFSSAGWKGNNQHQRTCPSCSTIQAIIVKGIMLAIDATAEPHW